MKRIGKALALALAVCALLSACGGGNAAPAADKGGKTISDTPSDGGGYPAGTDESGGEMYVIPQWPKPASGPPDYGEAPGRMKGCFYTGTTVVFDYGAFTASDDGVYFLDADGDAEEPVRVIYDSLVYDSSICTDGFTVYYISGGGEAMEASLEDGSIRQVTDGAGFPFFSGVVGAGADRVYVQIPGRYDNSFDEEDLDSVSAVSLETGEILETWNWFGGSGCAGGFTAIFGEGYDVSPRKLYVFDYDGNTVVEDEWAMGASVSGGKIFYSSPGMGGDGGEPIQLYRVDASGVVPVLKVETDPDDLPYGVYVNGFTALSIIWDEDDENGMRYEVYDLRTNERIPLSGDLVVCDGYTVNGEEYLVGLREVYRWRDGQADCVFELPQDLRDSQILLCGGHILLDGSGGEFYAFPLDPENTVHPIPVTAAVETMEEYDGKNGAAVTGTCTVFMEDSDQVREELARSLWAYNQETRQKTRNNAAECAAQASEQIENGFASPEDPFSVSTLSYIRRADTLAFSFVEHQTMDNRVNREALDIKTGYNYDPGDGHALALDEVIADEDALRANLLDRLEEAGFAERDKLDEFLFQLFKTRSLTSTDQFSWTLGYEGITFYFNGQINFPFSQSVCQCTIPFTDAPEIFNPKYFAVPDSYAYDILLDDYFMEAYQVQGPDGGVELWAALSREEGDDGEITVVMDADEAYSVPVYGFPVYGTLLHTGGTAKDGQPRTGGENYLLVQTCGDGMALDLLDLNGGLYEAWDFGQAALPQHLPETDDWDYENWGQKPPRVWLSDPDSFSVLYYDLSTENYTVRAVYSLNGGDPRLLDLFGASLAVG